MSIRILRKKKKLEKYEKVKLNGGCPSQRWPQSSEIPVTCFSFGSVSHRNESRPCYILQQQTTCHWIYVKQCFQAFPTVLQTILSQNFVPFEFPPMYSPISPELLKHSPSPSIAICDSLVPPIQLPSPISSTSFMALTLIHFSLPLMS